MCAKKSKRRKKNEGQDDDELKNERFSADAADATNRRLPHVQLATVFFLHRDRVHEGLIRRVNRQSREGSCENPTSLVHSFEDGLSIMESLYVEAR